MFERYTEKARRIIFFARYEASNFGSPYIETEHLLLGILREAKDVAFRFHLSAESIRNQIDGATVIREKVSTSVDLPLSNESKRVLSYAAEEAEMLGHKHIGSEHLFLGLLREEKSFAAELLREAGVRIDMARKEIGDRPAEGAVKPTNLSPHMPRIEFIENEQILSVTALLLFLPRLGEEVELDIGEEKKTYRVQNVRFVVVADATLGSGHPQRLEKIQILVKRIPSS